MEKSIIQPVIAGNPHADISLEDWLNDETDEKLRAAWKEQCEIIKDVREEIKNAS